MILTKTLNKKFKAFAVALTTLFLSGSAIGAVSPTPTSRATTVQPTVTTQVRNLTTEDFSGEVTKIDGRKLTIKLSNETKEITVPENVQIKKNSLDSNFGEIKVNDKIAFSQTSDGQIVSVSITSAGVSDFGKIALPLLLGFLLVVGVIGLLLKKGNKGHIKTSTERVN